MNIETVLREGDYRVEVTTSHRLRLVKDSPDYDSYIVLFDYTPCELADELETRRSIVKLVALTEYSDDNHDATIHINPAEVSAVREWRYHSFRPPVTEIILQSGVKLHVWQDVETTIKRLKEADEIK